MEEISIKTKEAKKILSILFCIFLIMFIAFYLFYSDSPYVLINEYLVAKNYNTVSYSDIIKVGDNEYEIISPNPPIDRKTKKPLIRWKIMPYIKYTYYAVPILYNDKIYDMNKK